MVHTLQPSSNGVAESGAVSAAGEGRIFRLLVPSFTDLFFIALIVWLFMIGEGWKGLLLDGDTGWHIRAGEFILDHGKVPVEDLFSFSKTGQPWFAWEWLSDVIYAVLYRHAGLKAIVLLSGILVVTAGTLMMRHMLWRGTNGLLSLILALIYVGAASIHYHARPHLFTLALFAGSMWILDRDLRVGDNVVWLLVPLIIVWTNLHGGFLALIACLALYIAGAAFNCDWGRVRRYGLLLAACSLGSLCNPYGIQLHRHIAAYLRSNWIQNHIQEFQSPSFRGETLFQYELLLFLGLMAVPGLLLKRKFAPALLIGYFAHASLASARHIPIYLIASMPFIATGMNELWARWVEGRSKHSIPVILDGMGTTLSQGFRRTTLWPGVFVAVLAYTGLPIKWPMDFPEIKFPVSTVNRHAALFPSARVFASDQWSDYLIYRFYPHQRVFVDGRSDFYGEKLGLEYLDIMNGNSRWRSLVDRYGFTLVLADPAWPLSSLLKQDPSWRVLSDSGKAILFERVAGIKSQPLGHP